MHVRIDVFDAFGTIFDVHSATIRHPDVFGDRADQLSSLWRAKQLEYTWVLNSLGRYEPFDLLTARALDFALEALGLGANRSVRDELLQAYTQLAIFPDVLPALERLKTADHKVVIFSNAPLRMLDASLAFSNIDHMIDEVISVEQALAFKPDRRAYALLNRWRGDPKGPVFYSSNRWDIAGASSVGLRTIWINRRGSPDEYSDLAPASIAETMIQAISMT
ncbi:haloacid dehalogenase type II [Methylocystis sp. IM3]|uniref:haloacid dehalogenase type II n=1 Tax=unclassified Methylocystis TaxID=2625913 RepID=UPI0030FC3847